MNFYQKVLLAMCLAVPAFGGITSTITVDTSTQNLSNGYIELQFNPSNLTTEQAYADIGNFATDGLLKPADPNNGFSGSITGTLPGLVTLGNDGAGADYFEGIGFGNTISFNLTLYGPAVGSSNVNGGGTFILDFLDSSFNPLFVNSGVAAFTVDINPDGSTTFTALPSEMNGPTDISFTNPMESPEPSTIALFGLGACALLALRRRRMAR